MFNNTEQLQRFMNQQVKTQQNKAENKPMKFETGKSYLMNWITSSSKLKWTVTKRTKATLWIISQNGQEEKRRIKTMRKSGNEYVEPFGRYSMSPVLRAKNII